MTNEEIKQHYSRVPFERVIDVMLNEARKDEAVNFVMWLALNTDEEPNNDSVYDYYEQFKKEEK